MGCDIHLYVEARPIVAPRWRRINRRIEIPGYRESTLIDMGWGEGRNYDAFAMLADVRNGYGFAGVDTGDAFKPIDQPRGLPDDMSGEVAEEAERWDGDGHSHSHFTLRELLNLEQDGYWDLVTAQRGQVTRKELEQAKDLVISIEGQVATLSGPPRSWAGAIGGVDEADIFTIQWLESYRQSAGWLLDTIATLRELADSYSMSGLFTLGQEAMTREERKYPVVAQPGVKPLNHWTDAAELVRIVFWFDN